MTSDIIKLAVFALILSVNRQALSIIVAYLIGMVVMYNMPPSFVLAGYNFNGSLLSSAMMCVMYTMIILHCDLKRNLKYALAVVVAIFAFDGLMNFLHFTREINYTESMPYRHWSVIMWAIDAYIAYLLVANVRYDAIHLCNYIYNNINIKLSSGTLFTVRLLSRTKSLFLKNERHGGKNT